MGFGKGTKILMYDGSIKNAENIVVGDEVMCENSTPGKVIKLYRGNDKMYRITSKNCIPYTVSENHPISLRYSSSNRFAIIHKFKKIRVSLFNIEGNCKMETKTFSWDLKSNYETELENAKKYYNETNYSPYCDITVKNYFNYNKYDQKTFKGYYEIVEFPEREINIDPWMLGHWLGHEEENNIKKIIDEKKDDDFLYNLEIYDLLDNIKHIPDDYKINSKENRLKLLAGLIDSCGKKSYIARTFKLTHVRNRKLVKDVYFLIRSLGLYSNLRGFTNIIGGDIEEIPLYSNLGKTLGENKNPRCPRIYNINIEPINQTEYFGFELDKNGRIFLEDYTISCNC